jgi:hypothetical protein
MRRIGYALASVCFSVGTLAAQDMWVWSQPGATGIVDDESTWAVALNDTSSASIRSSVSTATAKLRYPVTGGPARLDGFDPAICMRLSVRDTGPTARVVARLKAVNFASGQQFLLGSYDSDERQLPPSAQYQTAITCPMSNASGGTLQGFNYGDFSYYIEVELTKTDATGNPGIRFVGLSGG